MSYILTHPKPVNEVVDHTDTFIDMSQHRCNMTTALSLSQESRGAVRSLVLLVADFQLIGYFEKDGLV